MAALFWSCRTSIASCSPPRSCWPPPMRRRPSLIWTMRSDWRRGIRLFYTRFTRHHRRRSGAERSKRGRQAGIPAALGRGDARPCRHGPRIRDEPAGTLQQGLASPARATTSANYRRSSPELNASMRSSSSTCPVQPKRRSSGRFTWLKLQIAPRGYIEGGQSRGFRRSGRCGMRHRLGRCHEAGFDRRDVLQGTGQRGGHRAR